MSMQHIVNWIKDISQIAFWLILATIAVLTYRRARSTLLQPLRTEVFKAQLEELKKILGIFGGKDEIDLRRFHHFDDLLMVNCCALLDAYRVCFFKDAIDRKKRPYNPVECPVSIIKAASLELCNDRTSSRTLAAHPPSDPKATWNSYSCDEIHVPKAVAESQKLVSQISDNPILPSELTKLLVEYSATISKNIHLVGEVLAEAAKEFPESYPDIERTTAFSPIWIANLYNEKFISLKPYSDKITEYIRSHFDPDNLFNG